MQCETPHHAIMSL